MDRAESERIGTWKREHSEITVKIIIQLLESIIVRKLSYFGHIMRKTSTYLEKEMI